MFHRTEMYKRTEQGFPISLCASFLTCEIDSLSKFTELYWIVPEGWEFHNTRDRHRTCWSNAGGSPWSGNYDSTCCGATKPAPQLPRPKAHAPQQRRSTAKKKEKDRHRPHRHSLTIPNCDKGPESSAPLSLFLRRSLTQLSLCKAFQSELQLEESSPKSVSI